MRRKLIAGNWKMNRSPVEADSLAQALKQALCDVAAVDLLVAPPLLAIPAVVARLKQSNIAVGAQNLHHEVSGAFTGEISGEMLKQAGVSACLIGHSERRQLFGDTDEWVAKKVQAALRAKLQPILCVGETLAERDAGKAQEVVIRQVLAGLGRTPPEVVAGMVIAYEPVWAIGTGRTASPEQAQEMHACIRALLRGQYPAFVARDTRVLYGGSVKGSNARSLLSQPDVDGALVGGASLSVDEFKLIVEGAV